MGTAPLWAAGLIVMAGIGLTPVADELFYRGLLFRIAADRGDPWGGALDSSLLFALSRLDGINFPAYFALGLLLCGLYHRTGSLLALWTAHVLLNTAMFLLLFSGYS